MATAHLIHGYIGAGKTTFARRLEQQSRAMRFSPDDWMARLFGEDPPEAIFRQKADAILQVMEPLWLRCLTLDLDVVLDFGFWRRADRDRTRRLAGEAGACVTLYALSCDEEVARRRVAMRNMDAARSLYVAPVTFTSLKARFEALQPDEQAIPITTG